MFVIRVEMKKNHWLNVEIINFTFFVLFW